MNELHVLTKILVPPARSRLIVPSLAIAALYLSGVLWYAMNALCRHEQITFFIASLSFLLCAFIALYFIPDQLFTSSLVAAVLPLPLQPARIVCASLLRMAKLQGFVCLCAFWPAIIVLNDQFLSGLLQLCWAWLFSCGLNALLFLVCLAIAMWIRPRYVGYGYIVIQYGGFLFLALAAGRTVQRILTAADTDFIHATPLLLLGQSVLAAMLVGVTIYTANRWFPKAYENVQRFQKSDDRHTIAPTKLRHPYLLLEWKRISRNRTLIFYSNVKNLLTVCLLYHMLAQGLSLPASFSTAASAMLLLTCCSAINTLSSTAYSSDPNRAAYAYLPLCSRRIFLYKTLLSALFGVPTIVLFWFVFFLFNDSALSTALLALLYGLLMNVLCAWLGVFCDDKMPRTVTSTNALLHGNLSKVIVLFAALSLTFWEIHRFVSLATADLISGGIVCLLFAALWLTKKGTS